MTSIYALKKIEGYLSFQSGNQPGGLHTLCKQRLKKGEAADSCGRTCLPFV